MWPLHGHTNAWYMYMYSTPLSHSHPCRRALMSHQARVRMHRTLKRRCSSDGSGDDGGGIRKNNTLGKELRRVTSSHRAENLSSSPTGRPSLPPKWNGKENRVYQFIGLDIFLTTEMNIIGNILSNRLDFRSPLSIINTLRSVTKWDSNFAINKNCISVRSSSEMPAAHAK